MADPSSPADAEARPPSRWKTAYGEYRLFERQFADATPPSHGFSVLLIAAVRGQKVFERELADYQAIAAKNRNLNLPAPPSSLIDRLRLFAALRSSFSTDEKGFVYEDVYHLAFAKLGYWRSYGTPIPQPENCSRLYRGQRVDTWDVGASIYRDVPDGNGRREALESRTAAVRRLANAVATKLGLSFVDAVAVCQHYSDSEILGLPTWLVDFSRDPWVGLFFASNGGRTGECGIVWDILPTEFAGHAVGKSNPIGSLQFAVPANVRRIESQSGVFVIAGLPQIFSQYVAFGWDTRFHQHTGEVFEDAIMGIGPDTIYPADDELRGTLAELKAALHAGTDFPDRRDAIVPMTVFSSPYKQETYQALLQAWGDTYSEEHAKPMPAGLEEAIFDLSRFHALLHSARYSDRLPNIVSRSLHRLRTAFDSIYFAALCGEPVNVRRAIEAAYVEHIFHRQVLREALNETLPPAPPVRQPHPSGE